MFCADLELIERMEKISQRCIISHPDNETMYKAGFEELHYGLWGKILTDEEYKEIIKREEER